MTTCPATKKKRVMRATGTTKRDRYLDVGKRLDHAEALVREMASHEVFCSRPDAVLRLARVLGDLQGLRAPIKLLSNTATAFNELTDALEWVLGYQIRVLTGEDTKRKVPVFGIQVFTHEAAPDDGAPLAEGWGDSLPAAVVGAFLDHEASDAGGVN